jgi:acyl-CoA synthetase (AMP-forming)/AMP-acid ligase II
MAAASARSRCAAPYHKVERDPEKFTADGWLRTGDVATVDEHCYVRIVAQAAVIAIPNEKWSERPLACIVLQPGNREMATAGALRIPRHDPAYVDRQVLEGQAARAVQEVTRRARIKGALAAASLVPTENPRSHRAPPAP